MPFDIDPLFRSRIDKHLVPRNPKAEKPLFRLAEDKDAPFLQILLQSKFLYRPVQLPGKYRTSHFAARGKSPHDKTRPGQKARGPRHMGKGGKPIAN